MIHAVRIWIRFQALAARAGVSLATLMLMDAVDVQRRLQP